MDEEEREAKLEEMREWFHANYEDPAQRTPYMTSEGGYIWIWGGPYDAREELESNFGHEVPEDVIDELVNELNSQSFEWAPVPKPEDYDDELLNEPEKGIVDFYGNFYKALENVQTLLDANLDAEPQQYLHRLLFVNVITAMETYLSDAFINTVMPDSELVRKLVETSPEFKKEKISLSEIFKSMATIEDQAIKYLSEISWHHLQRVKPMYKDTLGIDFPKDLGGIYKAVLTRHDIVHRNGKTTKNEEVNVSADDVNELIVAVQAFVKHINDGIVAMNNPWGPDEF
jgi:hypothetical protein